MKVRLETYLIWYGRECEPGDSIEMPDHEAKEYIKRGYAIAMPAERPPVETAALRTTSPKGKQDVRIQTARR